MRVAHLSTFDQTGGAARAMMRLHLGLLAEKIDSHVYCSVKSGKEPNCHQLTWDEGVVAKLKRKSFKIAHPTPITPADTGLFFSQAASWTGAQALAQLGTYDLLHLHWIAPLPDQQIPAPVDILALANALPPHIPVVWTLHDMNAFTGGCHYTVACEQFKQLCGNCPQLAQPALNDASRETWQRKQDAYQKMGSRLTYYATSTYMADIARDSALLKQHRIETFPIGIDTETYRPGNKAARRAEHGIAPSTRVLLFVSDSLSNPLKGMALIVDALNKLRPTGDVLLLSVGSNPPQAELPIPLKHLGHIADERALADIYSLADIFIFPSKQEAFGQTPLEAMACGCAVAACPSGAIPDLIVDGEHGLIASEVSASALAVCIEKLLHDPALCNALGQAARKRAEQTYTLRRTTESIIANYRSLIQQ